ncbi:MAG: TIGR03905 family TSCPD domain-containing protein [Eubacteriales bacterium]|nr:TIGR03905 family TSCPD domain-containing protein [Eubacteriales bacterium]
MRYTVKPEKVCPTSLSFDLDGDVVTNVVYEGGCNGNLKAVSKLVDGMTVGRIEELLKGNTCGKNPTSCADQLAIAVRAKYEESRQQ